MERQGFLEPEAERLKAELVLKLQAQHDGGSVEAARAAAGRSPEDLDLKFQLAEALAAAGQYADALAICLELVERDRKGIGERARQTMIAIFQLLPTGSELVTEYQRQLSMVLYGIGARRRTGRSIDSGIVMVDHESRRSFSGLAGPLSARWPAGRRREGIHRVQPARYH